MSMLANLTKLGQTAAQKAAKLAESVATINLSKIQVDYEISVAENSYAGPGGVWKIHRARAKRGSEGSLKAVSVWMANKKQFQDQAASTGQTVPSMIEADAKKSNLLKHPGIVRVIEPLEETRTHFMFVTEEVHGSLECFLNGGCKAHEANDDTLSELEIKHGLDHVIATLGFLHGTCKIAHCNLCPASVVIAADGTWKLSNLGLSQPAASAEDLFALPPQSKKLFSYDFPAITIADKLSRPDIGYTAPELVASVGDGPVSGTTDVFSLACIMYRVLRKQPLFTASTTSEYRSTLASMSLIPVDGLPPSLQDLMRSMLNPSPASRPQAQAVLDAAFFREDRLLRALRFIDTILQRETAQKHAFIRDLPSFMSQFPKRMLRLRVLPCLIQQWQDSALRDAVLPLVLRMVKSLPPDMFQDQVLPELRAILTTATGTQMIEILRAVPDLQDAMRPEQIEEALVPIMLKALTSSDTRVQEEVLKALVLPLTKIGSACIHSKVLPQLLKACVNTKSASVRLAVLDVVAGLAPRLTEQESDVVGRMIKQLTSVDCTDATLVGVLKVCEAISGSKSAVYTMRVLVPLTSPLVTASTIQPATLDKYVAFMRDALVRMEQRARSKPQPNSSSNSSPSPSGWDDSTPLPPVATAAVPRAGSPALSGLGLGEDDLLAGWSSPVAAAAPAVTSKEPDWGALQAARDPMQLGGGAAQVNGGTSPMGAGPMRSLNGNSMAAPPQANGAHATPAWPSNVPMRSAMNGGRGPVRDTGNVGMRLPVQAQPQGLPVWQNQTAAVPASGVTLGGMNGSLASGGSGVAQPGAANKDPFADLFSTPVASTAPASKPQATQASYSTGASNSWDPFS